MATRHYLYHVSQSNWERNLAEPSVTIFYKVCRILGITNMYEKQTAKIIPFRSIDIFENAISAGTGNFLVDGPKETVRIDESVTDGTL